MWKYSYLGLVSHSISGVSSTVTSVLSTMGLMVGGRGIFARIAARAGRK
jgi:hypothetical protein